MQLSINSCRVQNFPYPAEYAAPKPQTDEQPAAEEQTQEEPLVEEAAPEPPKDDKPARPTTTEGSFLLVQVEL